MSENETNSETVPSPDAESIGRLVEYVASQLVDVPEDIEVEIDDQRSSVHVTLFVPDDQMGRVIGRQGRIARALRTVVMVAASRRDLRASLDIEEQYDAAKSNAEAKSEGDPEA